MRAFGSKLRALREYHGLSQLALAPRLALSNGHLNNLELGRREPSFDAAIRMALIFGVSTDYLLRDSIPLAPLPPSRLLQTTLPEAVASSFAQKVAYVRQHRRLSQVALAALLVPSSQATISNLEAGRKRPSPRLALQLADALRVSTDYLLLDNIPLGEFHDTR